VRSVCSRSESTWDRDSEDPVIATAIIASTACATSGDAIRKYRLRPFFCAVTNVPSESFARCQLAVCGETPAVNANSVALWLRPSSSAQSITARAGSPITPPISANFIGLLMSKT